MRTALKPRRRATIKYGSRPSRVAPTWTNYGGGKFAGWVVEEYLSGAELSIQAVAREGKAHILAFCEKLVTVEPRFEGALLCSFRESGHVAHPGYELDQDLAYFAQQCIEAVGYRTGPFHIDLIRAGRSLYFLEMGFRLSGMRVLELVDQVSGLSWADEAFRAHLGDIPGTPMDRGSLPYMGHLVLRNEAQMGFAGALKMVVESANVVVTRSASRNIYRKGTVPAALLADMARHIDAVGRVSVQASNPRLVMHLLMCCNAVTDLA